jgi:hypothetical protein
MFGFRKNRKLVDEQVKLGFILESEEETPSLGPVPMPEPGVEQDDELPEWMEDGLRYVKLLCEQLCAVGGAYAVEVSADGFTIYSDDDAVSFEYSVEDVEAARNLLVAELATQRNDRLPFRAFAGYAMEETGRLLHLAGRDVWRADVAQARRALRSLSLDRICAALDLDQGTATEYKGRLLHELARRWPVFVLDARNGEI